MEAKKNGDFIIGTSEKGAEIETLKIKQGINQRYVPLYTTFSHKIRVIILFGGLNGIEGELETSRIQNYKDPLEFCDYYINFLPSQRSRTIRTEEAVFLGLAYFSNILKF